jgi:hypothetical protein
MFYMRYKVYVNVWWRWHDGSGGGGGGMMVRVVAAV